MSEFREKQTIWWENRKSEIEGMVETLLQKYGDKYGQITSLPIPTDLITEKELGLKFLYGNISKYISPYPSNTLGVILPERRLIVIDQNIRYKSREIWTEDHEAGHWVLHVDRGALSTLSLFEEDEEALYREPYFCRRGKTLQEREADVFAACYGMPKSIVEEELRKFIDRKGIRLTPDGKIIERINKHRVTLWLSWRANRSYQAAEIRLNELGHIKTQSERLQRRLRW